MNENILEGLFKWTHEVVIVDSMGEPVTVENPDTGKQEIVKAYQRIVGDAEVAMARETALRASALKRSQLRDPTDLDRLLIVPEFDKINKDDLVSLTLLNELPEVRAQASRDLRFPYPEEPKSDATLEQQEKYQTAVDTYFARREEVLQEEVKELLELRKQELFRIPRQQLEILYEETAVNVACREEMLVVFNEMMAYLATYNDPEFTSRAFTTFSAFRNANTSIKRQLIEGYLRLEISGDKLKK